MFLSLFCVPILRSALKTQVCHEHAFCTAIKKAYSTTSSAVADGIAVPNDVRAYALAEIRLCLSAAPTQPLASAAIKLSDITKNNL
jgi:hypothetical protein